MKKALLILISVGIILLLFVVLLVNHIVNTIEDDIRRLVEKRIEVSSWYDISVDVDGAIVHVYGNISKQEQADSIIEIINSVQGVKGVVSHLKLPVDENAMQEVALIFHKQGDQLVVSGKVVGNDNHKYLLERVEIVGRKLKIEDLLIIDHDSTVQNEKEWRAAAVSALESVMRLNYGKVSVQSNSVSIVGVTTDGVEKRNIKSFLEQSLPDIYEMEFDVSSPVPLADPYVFVMSISGDGEVRVSECMAPDDGSMLQIVNNVKAIGGNFENTCMLRSGAPDVSWGDAVSKGTEIIKMLHNGTFTLRNRIANISGVLDESYNMETFEGKWIKDWPFGYIPRSAVVETGKDNSNFHLSIVRNKLVGTEYRGNIPSGNTLSILHSIMPGRTANLVEEGEAPEGWEDAIGFVLKTADILEEVVISFSERQFMVRSVVSGSKAKEISRILQKGPAGYRYKFVNELKNDELYAEASMLNALRVSRDLNGQITLQGKVPDSIIYDAIITYAKVQFSSENIKDEIQVEDYHIITGWYDAIVVGFNVLSKMKNGYFLVNDSAIEVVGTVRRSRISANVIGMLRDYQDKYGLHVYSMIDVTHEVQMSKRVCQGAIDNILQDNQIIFKKNSDDILRNSVFIVKEISDIMQRCDANVFEVGVHTDISSDPYTNLQLSQKRAKSVYGMLEKMGVLSHSMLAKGYGDSRPVIDSVSDGNNAQNNRIEIKILD